MQSRAISRLTAGIVISVLVLTFTPALTLAQDATPAPVGCTAGSSGIGDLYYPLLGNAGYDVQHYTLDLDLEWPARRSPLVAPRSMPERSSISAHSNSISLDWRSMRSRLTGNRHRSPAMVAI